jgi:hypothetical protein
VLSFKLPPQLHQMICWKGSVLDSLDDLRDGGKNCGPVVDQRAVQIEQDKISHNTIVTRR